jgi:hypothetical protein
MMDDHENLLGVGKKFNVKNEIENGTIDLEDLGFEFNTNYIKPVDDFIRQHQNYISGMSGFATLIQLVFSRKIKPKNQVNWDFVDKLTLETLKWVAPSTQVNPVRFLAEMTKLGYAEDSKYWRDFAETVKRIKQRALKQRNNNDLDELEEFFDTDLFRVKAGGKCVFISGLEHYHDLHIVQNLDELDRVIQTSFSISAIYEYAAYKHKEFIVTWLEIVLDYLFKYAKTNVNMVVKAFHRLRELCLFNLSNDLFIVTAEEMNAEIASEDIADMLPWQLLLSQLNTLSIPDRVEACYVYKFLPPPDFDVVSSMNDLKSWHTNPNKVTGDLKAFFDHSKMNFIRAYKKKFSSLPGKINEKSRRKPWMEKYEDNSLNAFEDSFADDIDLCGCLHYKSRGDQAFRKVEDKAMPVDDIEAYKSDMELAKVPKEKRNTLLYMLKSQEPIDTTKLPIEQCPKIVQAEYKPEAHKPKGRIFFMSHIKPRLKKAEAEGNIKDMLPYKSGVSMGLEPIKLEKYLSKLVDYHPSIFNMVNVYISFDMSKWSPKFPKEMKQAMWDFWSMIYDKKELKDYIQLTNNTKICSIRGGPAMNFVTPAVDFEGDQGAMNTWMHSDLMSFAVKTLFEKKLVNTKAFLCTFIDDGLLKITVEQDKIHEVWTVIEDTYRSFGFTTSKMKTNLSAKFATYLGRIWFEGVEITPGIKAFLKVMPDYTSKFRSFSEETNGIFATVQGAVKAGTPWEIAYMKYVREFSISVLRWMGWRASTSEVAIGSLTPWIVTPIGLGGFGLASFQHIVSTLEDSSFSMGVGILLTAAKAYPQKKDTVERILDQTIRPTNFMALMRNPKKIFRQGPTLDSSLVERVIVDYLKEHKMIFGEWFQDVLNSAEQFDAEGFAQAACSTTSLNIVILKELYKTTPTYLLEKIIGKFKKSDTILNLLGYTIGSRLYKAALKNFRAVVAANMSLF